MCSSTCSLATGRGDPANIACQGKENLEIALQKYFKYSSFRPGQLETLLPLIHGRDVFARMANWGRKISLHVPSSFSHRRVSGWCDYKSSQCSYGPAGVTNAVKISNAGSHCIVVCM